MNEREKAVAAAKKWQENLMKEKKEKEAVLLGKLIDFADQTVTTPFGKLVISDISNFYGSDDICIALETEKSGEELVAMVSYDEESKEISVSSFRPNSLDAHHTEVTHNEELCKDRDDILEDLAVKGKEWK